MTPEAGGQPHLHMFVWLAAPRVLPTVVECNASLRHCCQHLRNQARQARTLSVSVGLRGAAAACWTSQGMTGVQYLLLLLGWLLPRCVALAFSVCEFLTVQ